MTDYERSEYEQEIETLRSQVRQDEFEQLWSEGHRMHIEDAIELAVAEEN